jgi:hypothetical protein
VLLPSVLGVGAALVKPDLEMSLDRSGKQNSEALDKEKLYQNQFPNSSITHKPRGNHDTLVIPFGALLIAFWIFCLTIVIALILQMAMLLMFPIPIQWGILIGICMISLLASQSKMENAFFLYTHHWQLISLFTLGAFVFVQRFAFKRVQSLEIM